MDIVSGPAPRVHGWGPIQEANEQNDQNSIILLDCILKSNIIKTCIQLLYTGLSQSQLAGKHVQN